MFFLLTDATGATAKNSIRLETLLMHKYWLKTLVLCKWCTKRNVKTIGQQNEFVKNNNGHFSPKVNLPTIISFITSSQWRRWGPLSLHLRSQRIGCQGRRPHLAGNNRTNFFLLKEMFLAPHFVFSCFSSPWKSKKKKQKIWKCSRREDACIKWESENLFIDERVSLRSEIPNTSSSLGCRHRPPPPGRPEDSHFLTHAKTPRVHAPSGL